MSRSRWSIIAAVFVALTASSVIAAEKVGEAVLIKTTVTGDGGTLATRSPVHRDERIRTSSSGLGEFVFSDGTRFAVGGNSSVVIDKFVFNGSNSVQNLTINAAKGSFRWISGGSRSSAYKIQTPAGTIGIRGTAFDVYVGPGGVTAVVLLKGSVNFCGANGCRELKRRCDYVMATPKQGVTKPERVSRKALRELGNSRALPFVTGNQKLSRRFQVGSDCMTTASINPNRAPQAPTRSAPSSPEPTPPDPTDTPCGGNCGNGYGGGGGNGTGNEGKGKGSNR